MHFAALNGHLNICQLLLEVGASPLVWDKDGKSPLHLAAEKDHANVVKMFLGLKTEIDLLMVAVKLINKSYRFNCLSLDYHCKDSCGFTCAHMAAVNGSHCVMQELLSIDKQGVLEAKTKVSYKITLYNTYAHYDLF